MEPVYHGKMIKFQDCRLHLGVIQQLRGQNFAIFGLTKLTVKMQILELLIGFNVESNVYIK